MANLAPVWADEPLDPLRLILRAGPADDTFALGEAGWAMGGAGIRLRYSEGATFWINASFDTIWMQYHPPLSADDAAYFLLEPVLAFVLRRRGVLALHASAVAFGGTAVVFCGPAGAGKSTAAAACVAAGAEVLADDLVAVTELGQTWQAHPGVRSIRLWDEGASAILGRADHAPAFSSTWDKRVIAPELIGGRGAVAAVPLALICIVAERRREAQAPYASPVTGQSALAPLIANTAANYLHDAALRAVELQQLARLMQTVPAVRIVGHTDVDRLRALPAVVRELLDG